MSTAKYSFERYLNVRSAYGASFAPDGQRLSFLTDITGVAQLWSVPVDVQASSPYWPDQLTFSSERVLGATYSPVENKILVSIDTGGNELAQLYLLNCDDATLTALTDNPRAMYLFGGWSPDGMRIVYSSNERDARFFDVYERHLESGETTLLLQQDGTNYVHGYSPDGRQVLVSRHFSNIHNTLFLVDVQTRAIAMLTPEVQEARYEPAIHRSAAWSADRRGLYLLSNRERQCLSLAYLDLATKKMTYLRELTWDIDKLAVSEDGRLLAMVINEGGFSTLELFDISQGWDAQKQLRGPVLPGGVVTELSWSIDGAHLALGFVTSDDTLDVWVWDDEKGRVWRATHSSMGGIPRESLASPSLVYYPTFDGREIPAFLYLPQVEQREAPKLPAVIHVHGGPESQALPVFNPVIQYLVASGYAVLAPNVRGSTGYGYEYQSLDDVRLRMDSVKDLQYAALWLGESGIADLQRIAVMGGSYGGFMVLAAVTTYPDLWAAGVDIVGIANFVTFLEQTGPWRRKLREPEYGNLERDREFLESISPIRSVDRIKAPMFVVHGANDPRVPVGEAEQIVSALRARGVPVEYMRFEDEGHGLVRRANRLIAYPAIVRFLDEHLKADNEKFRKP